MKRWIGVILLFVVLGMTSASCSFVSGCKSNNRHGSLHWIDMHKEKDESVGLVIVTHGWVEKGDEWPMEMAAAICEQTNDEWMCGYYDWGKNAMTVLPKVALECAEQREGKALAEQILALDVEITHVHLLGHSCGCWVINDAARELAKQIDADIHLTFFDAYVPNRWPMDELGAIEMREGNIVWAEHYFTKDYTLKSTQRKLPAAHNVDVTKIDGGIKDHNFPWRWYLQTIREYQASTDSERYGYAKSREAGGEKQWKKSRAVKNGKTVIIENERK